jgi:outer membrane receptor protein involved in Fe transport
MKTRNVCFLPLVFALLAILPAAAQTVTGRLIGSVQDSSQAAVPNAQITITNEATGLAIKTSTDVRGDYIASALPLGSYTIRVEAPGFRVATSAGNVVSVAQTLRVDFTMQVGTLSETVDVTAAAPLVESTTSELGQTIGQRDIQTLPLNGRIFSQLVALSPGAIAMGQADQAESSSGAGARTFITTSVNGLPWSGTSYTLDGVNNKEPQNAFINIAPPIEAIEEFKVQTNNPSAEFGAFGGAAVNLTMRSGTNQLHGSLFEYLRNNDLNARNFFAATRAPFKTNQFGATMGGPIIKNKAFIFGDYQGLRLRNGQTFTLNVPTVNMRQGIFTAAEGFGTIYDPDNGNTPFAGNRIPSTRFDPVAAKVANLWPLPNAVGGLPVANFITNVSQQQQVDAGDIKGDYVLNPAVRLFVRESYNRRDYVSPPPGGIFIAAGQENAQSRQHNAVVGYTHTISPSMISEFRLGFNRFNTFHFGADFGTDENNILGIPNGNLAAFPESSGIANFNVSGIQATGSPLSTNGLRASAQYEITEALTLTRGQHAFKFGIDASRLDATVTNPEANPRGQFDFDSSLTSNQGSGGTAFASFLLGYPNTISRGFVNTKPDVITYVVGLYAQDDYRISKKLTLNLGVRWDYFTHPRERHNRQTNFSLTDGMMHTASSSDTGPNLTNYNGFSPRVGLAYSPDGGKTAIRTAFGISHFSDNFGGNGGSLERDYPLFETFTFQKQQTFVPFAKVSTTGLPGFVPVNLTSTIPLAPGVTPIVITREFQPDAAIMWNFGVQRQLTANNALEVSYVGTHGLHIFRDRLINAPLFPGPGAIDPRRPLYSIAPQVQTVRLRASDGNSIYNSLQVRYTRRFAAGLSLTGSYTWANSIDNLNVFWPYDDALNRGASNSKTNDVRHTFSSAYTYELPVGAGKRWLSHGSRIAQAFLGGWSVNGITTARTGFPLVIAMNTSLLNTGTGNRANINCSSVSLPKLVSQWFDPSCFSAPAQYQFGNSGKGHVRGPGVLNFDLSAFKSFHFGEKRAIEFRSEFFNAFNNPHFNNPQVTFGNSDFGRITSTILTPREVQLGLKFTY